MAKYVDDIRFLLDGETVLTIDELVEDFKDGSITPGNNLTVVVMQKRIEVKE